MDTFVRLEQGGPMIVGTDDVRVTYPDNEGVVEINRYGLLLALNHAVDGLRKSGIDPDVIRAIATFRDLIGARCGVRIAN